MKNPSIKRVFRRIKTRLSFYPQLIRNSNSGERQLVWRGRLRGKKVIVKDSRNIEEHYAEKQRRRELIKHLKEAQGNSYELKVSKRYPAPNENRLELYYNLPTRSEVLQLYIHKIHPKVRSVMKKSGLAGIELYEKCEAADHEMRQRLRTLDLEIDTYAGNILVDVNSKGKIIFTLIDF